VLREGQCVSREKKYAVQREFYQSQNAQRLQSVAVIL
jgi:hypothetical protein